MALLPAQNPEDDTIVKYYQSVLSFLGFQSIDGTPLVIDGDWGSNTQNALQEFINVNSIQNSPSITTMEQTVIAIMQGFLNEVDSPSTPLVVDGLSPPASFTRAAVTIWQHDNELVDNGFVNDETRQNVIELLGGDCIAIHIKILVAPVLPVDDFISGTRRIFGPQANILVKVGSREHLPGLTPLEDLDIQVPGHAPCVPGQHTTEQLDLYTNHRNFVGSNEIAVYFLRSMIPIHAGCAAHPPLFPSLSIAQNAASEFTVAHELAHLLGVIGHPGPATGLMTAPIGPFPSMIPSVRTTVQASPLLGNCL